MSELLTILVVALAMASSFLFSGMEAGLFALSRVRIRQLMRNGNRRARTLYGYLEAPEPFLWTILIGNTIANFLLVALLVVTLFELLPTRPVAFGLVLVVIMFAYYLCLDLLPKTLFRRFPNRMCLLMVEPFRWLAFLHVPVVTPMAWLARLLSPRNTGGQNFFGNREELRALMEDSQNPLTTEERTLVNRILKLQKLTVQRVAVPWDKVSRTTVDTPAVAVRKLLADRGQSRMPVTSADGRRVVGVVTVKTLLFREHLDPEESVESFMTPALFLDPGTRLEEALKQFQQGGHRQAVLLDSARHPVGIVSLTDVLKVMFGEVTW
ncbi:MAG TPA: hypothetical protein DCY13_18230 [Verrucomicrobiales bacterium]|nr:hypothetical protein [Verrucomicrobiales bacterium]